MVLTVSACVDLPGPYVVHVVLVAGARWPYFLSCLDCLVDSIVGRLDFRITRRHVGLVSQPVTETPAKLPAVKYHGIAGRIVSILIVEDNPDVLKVTAKTIENAGYAVSRAADGDAALKLIKNSSTQFDLLCIDGVIPGTSSAKVIEFVQQNHSDMRIVVCSGYIEEE